MSLIVYKEYFEDKQVSIVSSKRREQVMKINNVYREAASIQKLNFALLNDIGGLDINQNTPPSFEGSVHIIWCRGEPFEYRHYLSIISVVQQLHPARILFYATSLPQIDEHWYYLWFEEIMQILPNFSVLELPSDHGCQTSMKAKIQLALDILHKEGGVYIGENILLDNISDELFSGNSIHTLDINDHNNTTEIKDGIIFLKRGDKPDFNSLKQMKSSIFECADENDYNMNSFIYVCVRLNRNIVPKDIWKGLKPLEGLIRRINYGRSSMMEARRSDVKQIPNIAHYVWFGKLFITFSQYLSLLSTLYIQEVDKIMIHTDSDPTGSLWEELRENTRIQVVHWDRPTSMYQTGLKNVAHLSDVMRVDILSRYGGIYMDWDVFWISKTPDFLMFYDFVTALDWPTHGDYPDEINTGLSMAKQGSLFLKAFRDTMRYYRDDIWDLNAIKFPYKVYEKLPRHVYVYSKLQVSFKIYY